MHVVTSDLLDTSATVVGRDGEAVLVLREGMLSAEDLDVLQRVCAPVEANVNTLADLAV